MLLNWSKARNKFKGDFHFGGPKLSSSSAHKRLTMLDLMKKLNKLKDEFEAQKTLLKPSRGVYVSPPVINHSS